MSERTVLDLDLDLGKSRGSYLHDRGRGRDYLDFHSMYSSLPLGYNHPVFDGGFYAQVNEIASVKVANNVCRTPVLQTFRSRLKEILPLPHVHFTCTGSLAVESAIKCALEARKLAAPMVLSLKQAFHGVNSWGVVTDRCFHSAERLRYSPRFPWLQLALEDLIAYLKTPEVSDVAAVVIELVLCTAGDLYQDPELLREARALCAARDVCFIVDEIQTGFGTTGRMWYSETLDLVPDVLVFGKKSQVSGIAVSDRYAECLLSPHFKLGVTFDGDLMDALRATYVLKAYEEGDLLAKAVESQRFFRETLAPRTRSYRGAGHLIAFDLESEGARDGFLARAFAKGLLCNKAGPCSVRLRPNLALSLSERTHFASLVADLL